MPTRSPYRTELTRIVLLAGEGTSNKEIAEKLDT